MLGRPLHELYREQLSRNLANFTKKSDSLYVTAFKGLNLSQYIEARRSYCALTHSECLECPLMLRVAKMVEENGFVSLKEAFTSCFPEVTYNPAHARRRLLQMPLACLRIDYDNGTSECYLVEHLTGCNYASLQALMKNAMQRNRSVEVSLSKDDMKSLLSLCTSD